MKRAGTSASSAPPRPIAVAYPDETVRDAVVKLLRLDIGRLPVVSRDDPRALVGYLGRAHVMSARLRWYRSEHTKEGGWGALRARNERAGVAETS